MVCGGVHCPVWGVLGGVMNYRIQRPQTAFTASKNTAPVEDKNYSDFIRSLPCMVTLTHPVHAAHVSTAHRGYGHLGRGKGTRASDRWQLPLCEHEHLNVQHKMNELEYWKKNGIDAHVAALTLHGLWADMGEKATPLATELILERRLGKHG